jgi:hypothetical protein
VLETLPHAVSEVAVDAAAARVSLTWLAADLDARVRESRRWPEMLLVIVDLACLSTAESGVARLALSRIVRDGGRWGLHVVAGASRLDRGLKSAGFGRPDVAQLTLVEPEGWLAFAAGRRAEKIAGARVDVVDLDSVARGLRGAAASTVCGAAWPSFTHRSGGGRRGE